MAFFCYDPRFDLKNIKQNLNEVTLGLKHVVSRLLWSMVEVAFFWT